MLVDHIIGWGKPTFIRGSTSREVVHFNQQITFKREKLFDGVSVNGLYYRRDRGYRVEYEIELFNIREVDKTVWQDVFRMINEGGIVAIKPYSNSGYTLDNMICISDVEFENLKNIQVGQRVTLKFKKADIVGSIPSFPYTTDEAGNYLMINSSDYLLKNSTEKIEIGV